MQRDPINYEGDGDEGLYFDPTDEQIREAENAMAGRILTWDEAKDKWAERPTLRQFIGNVFVNIGRAIGSNYYID